MKLKRVVIIGGTHGNEWTGITLIKNYADSFKKKFPELELEFVLGNQKAYEANRRFTEEDLNRAFQFLGEKRTSYEHQRAHEIKALIDRSPCFVIDMHTTTANMGKTVILSHYEKVNCHVARSLSAKFSDCRVIGSPDPEKKYLSSQSPYGMMIEVGPVANGLVEARALESTLEILNGILSEIQALPKEVKGTLECYEEVQNVAYPVDEKNQISAYIHSGFQNKDFAPINGAYVPFRHFSGEEIPMKTEEVLYPIFINEAAYYPQQLAFTLCRKKNLNY